MVDRILENIGNRAVVLGGDEHQPAGRGDASLQPLDRFGLVRVVVLVVERQIADVQLLERKLWRRQLHDGVGELAVERRVAKAADNDCDAVLTHDRLLGRFGKVSPWRACIRAAGGSVR